MAGAAGLAAAAAVTCMLLYVVLPSGWLLSRLLGFLVGKKLISFHFLGMGAVREVSGRAPSPHPPLGPLLGLTYVSARPPPPAASYR